MRSGGDRATTYYHWAVAGLSALAVVAVVLAGVMLVLVRNQGSSSAPAPVTITTANMPQPAPAPSEAGGEPPLAGGGENPTGSGFDKVKEAVEGLVTANATWRHPPTLTVEQTQRVGLEIGHSDEIADAVNELLQGTVESPAGQVKVASSVKARLIANPNDADIEPSDTRNASTSREIGLLWTWMVRPKRPMDSLLLTAELYVPLAGGDGGENVPGRLTEIPLEIPAHRTLRYTLNQIFSNWATWAAIVGAVSTGATWSYKKWKQRKKQTEKFGKTDGRQESPADSAESPIGNGDEPTRPSAMTTARKDPPP